MLTVLTSTLAMCLRQARHLAEVPVDLFWMPVYILFSTLFLMPIRLYGFIRLGHVGGWGTRADAFTAEPVAADVAVGAGGASATSPHPVRSPDERPTGGDPRGLIPYILASAILVAGVAYDVVPV